MRFLRTFFLTTLFLLTWPLFGQPIDSALAKQYFAEMKAVSDRDDGKLWGVTLYGPMMFADPVSHQIVANQSDRQGKLRAENGVFTGKLPDDLPIANTGIDWAGVRWTMVMWPLPQDRRPRERLMAHESFHRIQPRLGLEPLECSNNHLDTRIGRTWLQLEWRALSRALATTGAIRRRAISDALYFRALRRNLIPGAAENENRLEANEGVAEYTGVKLSARYPQEAALVAELALGNGPNRSPFVRSFAYVSGPAYGILLDESGMRWRKKLKPDSDLGVLLARAYRISRPGQHAKANCGIACIDCQIACPQLPAPLVTALPTATEAISRAQKYDGDEVVAREKEREVRQQKIIAEDRARLIDGPVLVLPASPDINYSFDPNEVTAIDENNSVFGGSVQVVDSWGTLEITGGVLIVRGAKGSLERVQIPAPVNPETSARSLSAQGWKLELRPGWKLSRGPRPQDWSLTHE
jgi:hypothetical protein